MPFTAKLEPTAGGTWSSLSEPEALMIDDQIASLTDNIELHLAAIKKSERAIERLIARKAWQQERGRS